MAKYDLLHQKIEIRNRKMYFKNWPAIGSVKNLDLKFSNLSVLLTAYDFGGEKQATTYSLVI